VERRPINTWLSWSKSSSRRILARQEVRTLRPYDFNVAFQKQSGVIGGSIGALIQFPNPRNMANPRSFDAIITLWAADEDENLRELEQTGAKSGDESSSPDVLQGQRTIADALRVSESGKQSGLAQRRNAAHFQANNSNGAPNIGVRGLRLGRRRDRSCPTDVVLAALRRSMAPSSRAQPRKPAPDVHSAIVELAGQALEPGVKAMYSSLHLLRCDRLDSTSCRDVKNL
jgi:hypothetical protein